MFPLGLPARGIRDRERHPYSHLCSRAPRGLPKALPPSAGVPEHSLHPKQFLPATVTVPGQGGREAAARRPDARTSSKTSSPREYCRQSSVGTRTDKFESRHFQTSCYFYRINSIRQFFEHELHKSILGHGGRLQGQPSGSECWWPWPWPIGAGGHGGAESLPRSRSHVLKAIARRGAVLHGGGRELQEQRRLQPASRSLPSSEGTRSGRRWVPRASTYSGAPASPALLGRPVGCPAPQSLWEKTERFSEQQGVASRDTWRPEWERRRNLAKAPSSPAPATRGDATPPPRSPAAR